MTAYSVFVSTITTRDPLTGTMSTRTVGVYDSSRDAIYATLHELIEAKHIDKDRYYERLRQKRDENKEEIEELESLQGEMDESDYECKNEEEELACLAKERRVFEQYLIKKFKLNHRLADIRMNGLQQVCEIYGDIDCSYLGYRKSWNYNIDMTEFMP